MRSRLVPAVAVSLLAVCPGALRSEGHDVFMDDFEWGSICAWANLWYPDADGDQWGDLNAQGISVSCPADPGLAPRTGDCHDQESTINPGAAEVCNQIDDDCDGATDEDLADELEPSSGCVVLNVATSSSGPVVYDMLNIYPPGDDDSFTINAIEDDETCQCCDAFCQDEDYQLEITLTVPAGAGPYTFCIGMTCGEDESCETVAAGGSHTWTLTFDGGCGTEDAYSRFVHVFRSLAAEPQCLPYTLTYELVAGCFD